MNKYIKMSILPICLALSVGYTSSTTAETQTRGAYQIETIASSSAYPTGIQVIPEKDGLHIIGRVTHNIHQARRIRGHVDIEFVDASGKIVKRITVPLQHQYGRVKRTHSVPFSAIIHEEVPNEYRIRIRHNIGNADHQ